MMQRIFQKRKDWTDNDGKGGKEKFWSDQSELCLVECHEGIQVGKYSAKYKQWSNEYIGSLEHVTKWKYLK